MIVFYPKETSLDYNLVVGICLVLVLLSYLISACHKNVLFRCIRCPGLRTHGIAAILSVCLTKATQFALLALYLEVAKNAAQTSDKQNVQ